MPEVSINQINDSYVFLRHSGGHRENYLTVLQKVTGFQSIIAQDRKATVKQMLNVNRLLFATVEDDLRTFLAVALQRSFRGKSTVGLVMGAGRCFESGHIKYKIKLNTFRAFRRLPQIKLLSILPFYLDDRFLEVTSDWIYDPQFWDLSDTLKNGHLPQTLLSEKMTTIAGGRQILLFLGAPSDIKGFLFLEKILLAQPNLAEKLLIAVAGHVNLQFKAAQVRLTQLGVWFVDKFLSENEVVSLKAASNTLWACYEPTYNSSSGIFGRALQLDKQVIVRRGSYLDRIAAHVSYPIETCEYGNVAEGIAVLEKISTATSIKPSAELSRQFYKASVDKLRRELGLDF